MCFYISDVSITRIKTKKMKDFQNNISPELKQNERFTK